MEVRGIRESGGRNSMRVWWRMRSSRLATRAAMTERRSALSHASASMAASTAGENRPGYLCVVERSSRVLPITSLPSLSQAPRRQSSNVFLGWQNFVQPARTGLRAAAGDLDLAAARPHSSPTNRCPARCWTAHGVLTASLTQRRPGSEPSRGRSLPVSYTHLRAHETVLDLVCRLLLE